MPWRADPGPGPSDPSTGDCRAPDPRPPKRAGSNLSLDSVRRASGCHRESYLAYRLSARSGHICSGPRGPLHLRLLPLGGARVLSAPRYRSTVSSARAKRQCPALRPVFAEAFITMTVLEQNPRSHHKGAAIMQTQTATGGKVGFVPATNCI